MHLGTSNVGLDSDIDVSFDADEENIYENTTYTDINDKGEFTDYLST